MSFYFLFKCRENSNYPLNRRLRRRCKIKGCKKQIVVHPLVFEAFRNWKIPDDQDVKMKEIFGKCARGILDLYKNENKYIETNYIGRDQNVKAITKRIPSRILLSEEMIQFSYKIKILVTMEKKYLVGFPNNISKLEKFECPRNANDEDVKKLVPHFQRIKCLRFWQCKNVTDIGINYFSSFWPNKTPALTELILYDCEMIGDAAVANVLKSCTKLKILFLSGTLLTAISLEHIDDKSVQSGNTFGHSNFQFSRENCKIVCTVFVRTLI